MNYIDKLARDIYTHAEGAGEPSPFDRVLYRMYALLALCKGTETTLEDVHDAWSAWCAEDRPNHPSLVSFDQLSTVVQERDQPYVDAIHAVARMEPPPAPKPIAPTLSSAAQFDKNGIRLPRDPLIVQKWLR